MLARRMLLATAAATLLLTPAVPAIADIGGPVTCDQQTDPYCNVYTGSPGSGGTGSGGTVRVTCHTPVGLATPCYVDGLGWYGADGCYYALQSANTRPVQAGPSGHWYLRTCIRLRGMTGWVWLTDANAPGPAALARVAEARMRLPRPNIRLSPPAATMQLVGVPTWLWLPATSFTTQQVSASVPGVLVTARATPTRAVWHTGDGVIVICRGRGTEWTTTASPSAASPTCGHTYTRSSAGQPGNTFALTVTVTWRITWTQTGGPSSTLPDLVTTATMRIPVGQAQTVITG